MTPPGPARTTGFSGPLPPARFNMARYAIGRPASLLPSKIALIVLDDPSGRPAEAWSFADLDRGVRRIAAALRQAGLRKGDRLLIRLDNTSAYALLFFGTIAAGLIAIPAATQLTETEARFLLDDSGAAAVAVADRLPAAARPSDRLIITPQDVARWLWEGEAGRYAATAGEDPAFLIYTSGTTSRPKGVLHAQRSAWGRRPMYQGWYGIGRDDRMLHAGAFNWTYTLGTGLTDPWANAATAIIYTGEKDPALWPRLIAATGATLFAAVPGVYRQILKYASPVAGGLGALRHGLVAGETPPPGLFEAWRADTGRELYEALGMSEISTFLSSSPSAPRRPGTVGRPQPGRAVAILPADDPGARPLGRGREGLLAVHRSDPGMMLGYWRRPAEEAEVFRGSWFVGGDLARMDRTGYVTHLGRANDIMKAMGYRVSPLEVEAVLAMHPGVAEVACTEVRVRADVSVIGAFVVPREPAKPPAAAELAAFAAERLAAYKCPREFRIVGALPRTANGKVKRSALVAS